MVGHRTIQQTVAIAAIAMFCCVCRSQSIFDDPALVANRRPSEIPTTPSAKPAAGKLTCPAKFVMSLCTDLQGNIFVGTEDQGVWKLNPTTGKSQRFTTKDNLGDDNGYALACDKMGRIWAGHLRTGLSVYDGKRWQNYDVIGGLSRPDSLAGPIGERVFAIKLCEKTGDVWIATNAGIAVYSEEKDAWSYITRADGLPSDECNAIAFDREGNAYIGTACDGITMAKAADNYKHWRTVTGPDRVPLGPRRPGPADKPDQRLAGGQKWHDLCRH